MSVTVPMDPSVEIVAGVPDGELRLNVFPEGDSCVVHAAGELDRATRLQLFAATTAGSHPTMVIDLADVTFMDCGGYGCLVASRLVVEAEGRTLTIRGQTGQPSRLFNMIARLESADSAKDQVAPNTIGIGQTTRNEIHMESRNQNA